MQNFQNDLFIFWWNILKLINHKNVYQHKYFRNKNINRVHFFWHFKNIFPPQWMLTTLVSRIYAPLQNNFHFCHPEDIFFSPPTCLLILFDKTCNPILQQYDYQDTSIPTPPFTNSQSNSQSYNYWIYLSHVTIIEIVFHAFLQLFNVFITLGYIYWTLVHTLRHFVKIK